MSVFRTIYGWPCWNITKIQPLFRTCIWKNWQDDHDDGDTLGYHGEMGEMCDTHPFKCGREGYGSSDYGIY